MPTYQYRCTECGFKWEEVLRVKDIDEPLINSCISCDAKGDIASNTIVRVPTMANLGKAQSDLKGVSKQKMDPTVRDRIELIKNRKDVAPETSKIDW